jgi:hypothetical protein
LTHTTAAIPGLLPATGYEHGASLLTMIFSANSRHAATRPLEALTCSKGVRDITLGFPIILEEVHQLAALAKRLLRARDSEILP